MLQAMGDLAGSKQKRIWLLSQSFLGWPSNRPRLYTVLLRKGSGILGDLGLKSIEKLYRVPRLSAMHHLLAPSDPWFVAVGGGGGGLTTVVLILIVTIPITRSSHVMYVDSAAFSYLLCM